MSKYSWSERFALIDKYSPTDEQIVRAFGSSQAELNTARALRAAGTITVSSDFDADSAGNVFESNTVTSTKSGVTKVSSASSVTKVGTKAPESATKRVVAPKKRGRKGTKIAEAFKSIPAQPVPVEDFAKQYGVSIPVLRQSKRFDTSPDLGEVRVKVSKDTGKLMIWREASSS
jgi:hypothetical protein